MHGRGVGDVPAAPEVYVREARKLRQEGAREVGQPGHAAEIHGREAPARRDVRDGVVREVPAVFEAHPGRFFTLES